MPKIRKYKRKNKRKNINKSIYKSNVNKQSIKIVVPNQSHKSNSTIPYMYTPQPYNLTDIKSTVRGTIDEILKENLKEQQNQQQNQQQQKQSVNNPLNKFENKNENMLPLSEILNKQDNYFSEYDDGTYINSGDYEGDDYDISNLFLKESEKELESMFESPLKIDESNKFSIRKSHLPDRKSHLLPDRKTHSEEIPKNNSLFGSIHDRTNDEEKLEDPNFIRKRSDVIRKANQRHSKIKETTMIKYKIKLNSDGKYE